MIKWIGGRCQSGDQYTVDTLTASP